jgi:hypothetical protein
MSITSEAPGPEDQLYDLNDNPGECQTLAGSKNLDSTR